MKIKWTELHIPHEIGVHAMGDGFTVKITDEDSAVENPENYSVRLLGNPDGDSDFVIAEWI